MRLLDIITIHRGPNRQKPGHKSIAIRAGGEFIGFNSGFGISRVFGSLIWHLDFYFLYFL